MLDDLLTSSVSVEKPSVGFFFFICICILTLVCMYILTKFSSLQTLWFSVSTGGLSFPVSLAFHGSRHLVTWPPAQGIIFHCVPRGTTCVSGLWSFFEAELRPPAVSCSCLTSHGSFLFQLCSQNQFLKSI